MRNLWDCWFFTFHHPSKVLYNGNNKNISRATNLDGRETIGKTIGNGGVMGFDGIYMDLPSGNECYIAIEASFDQAK